MNYSGAMETFCRGEFFDPDEFWNKNATTPHFADCFLHTVFIWIPATFLFLLSPLQFYLCWKANRLPLPWTALLVTKLVVNAQIATAIGIALVYTVAGYANDGNTISQADIVGFTILLIAVLSVFALTVACRFKGLVTSGVIFLLLVLFFIFGIPEFITRTKDLTSSDAEHKNPTICAPKICYLIYFILLIILLILHCFADKPADYRAVGKDKQCPEFEVSFFSRLMFCWLDRLCLTGWRRSLTSDDLWTLNDRDTSRELVKTWESQWTKRVHHYWSRKAALSPTHQCTEDDDKTQRLGMLARNGKSTGVPNPDIRQSTSASCRSHDQRKAPAYPSIIRCLFSCMRGIFIRGTIAKSISDALQFINPMVLSLLLQFISSPDEPSWKGYFYASLMFMASLMCSILTQSYYNGTLRMGMNIRTMLVSAIFKKALCLSNSARRRYTAGEIVNLMSVDVQRYMDVVQYINYLWSAPFVICLSMYSLYQQLGPSVFAGFGVMILLVPFNIWVSIKQRRLQFAQMKLKDSRIKMVNEILNGIKVLKFYAWEESFQNQVLEIRSRELAVLKSNAYFSACSTFTWTCAPVMVAVVSFASFILVDPENNILTPQRAFVSLSLFNILKIPLTMMPMVVSFMVQAAVSNKRIKEFLVAEELDTGTVERNTDQPEAVRIENGNFTWDKDTQTPNLENIHMRVMPGQLVAIVGQVGAGKSSLISAILGEMDRLSGYVGTKGKVAYVPQQAWIQNLTLRENIIFSKPFDKTIYNKIVDACALKTDLEILPGGDSTEIGEKGINVSGGQKQRISLARAVYQNADIYLLDDPLSAVDAHVGRHIFDNVLSNDGVLKGKTRILVTHGLGYLKNVDQIIVLRDGRITETGTYKELLSRHGAFADLIENYLEQKVKEAEDDISVLEEVLGDSADEEIVESYIDFSQEQRSRFQARISHNSEKQQRNNKWRQLTEECAPKPISTLLEAVKRASIAAAQQSQMGTRMKTKKNKEGQSKSMTEETSKKERSGTRLIQEESSGTGQVKWKVYKDYFAAAGYWTVAGFLLLYAISQAFVIASSIWLSSWSDDSLRNTTVSQDMRVSVYAVLGVAQAIFTLFGTLLMAYGMVIAGGHLHEILLRNLLRSPMSFYDVTPMGRIMNRIGKDVDIVDNSLQNNVRTWLLTVMGAGATLVVIMIGLPIFGVVILPMGLLYYFIQRFYICTTRQLKRLESISRSPVYSHFQETISGCAVIRAYDVTNRFIDESERRVDFNNRSYWPNVSSNRWLGIRLDLIGNLLVVAAAVLAVLSKTWDASGSTAGMIGVAMSYAMSITVSLNITVRMASEVESNVVAVERIEEYSETPTEADWHTNVTLASGWPQAGEMDFDSYKLRYRPGLELVLKGISCQVAGGEKIGIIGRTGAGKSSLTLALFRMVEAAGGKIVIDGQDISKLGLHDLRSKLTIIPQEPVLFSGNLRMNLDPFQSHSDEQIWVALEQSHLKDFVAQTSSKLMYPVSEGGENLSIGQRQLICLARALLRKTKVLILDEATAAVDLETDDLIQKTILTHFADCTILTIAHRLNTILDSDRVMVLSQGEIVEFDNPQRLLQDENTVFHGMAKDAGII